MKKKWNFIFDNEWNFYTEGGFSVELFSINWQDDFKCFVIFGFGFTWEK